MKRPYCFIASLAMFLLCTGHIFAGESSISQESKESTLLLVCDASNDLFQVLEQNKVRVRRFDTAISAVTAASRGSGILILADKYPEQTVTLSGDILKIAEEKSLRLFVEYPGSLPGQSFSPPRRIHMERVVVTSDAFGKTLSPMDILAVHDCHFTETEAVNPLLVVAVVAGFNRAVYGLAETKSYPILYEIPGKNILVCTTKLSQFVTARYATSSSMQAVWNYILHWAAPTLDIPELEWDSQVHPTYSRTEPLDAKAQRSAVQRGIDWHGRSGMVLSEEGWKAYQNLKQSDPSQIHNPVADRPEVSQIWGDGRFGIMEGFASQIAFDGSQKVRWWLRTDSNGESSAAFALRWRMDGDKWSKDVATNVLDWLYFNSGLFQNDPEKANYGLIYWGPDNAQALYQDNDIRAILGTIGTAAALQSDRWDKELLKVILGNFRTTGPYGFRGWRLENPDLLKNGWKHYWNTPTILYQPHYEAWMQSAYLWLYDKTGHKPLLERTRFALKQMMEAYPDQWRWTNGIQQERTRMLLPLSWLVRVDDTPEHREWLKRIATDIAKHQVECGAIREELGELSMGDMRPPQSNREYGHGEAPLIAQNGDPVADLLYTCNFGFLGLHEAYAATGDPQYKDMADKLADFLIRIQVKSETHPELDGGWFRAFDYSIWDYWGSNADAGWGAWAIETGWTQGWISTVLALRETNTSLWDLSKQSQVNKHFKIVWDEMIGDTKIPDIAPSIIKHQAVGKRYTLATKGSPTYSRVEGVLTDGRTSAVLHSTGQWNAWEGGDMEATIDMEQVIPIRNIGLRVLQSTRVGIFFPSEVVISVSPDGEKYQIVGTLTVKFNADENDPQCKVLEMNDLNLQGRYVRIFAKNYGMLPDWVLPGARAWLFVDEIFVNKE